MSPEAQRVAIAEFCKLPPEVTWKLPSSFVVDNENRFLLPDFTNDLNACHEMEKTIVDWVTYRMNLSRIVGIGYGPDLDICDDIKSFLSATAAQRCEAFLKTLNLWKE